MTAVTSDTQAKITEVMNIHVRDYKRRANQMAEIAEAGLFPSNFESNAFTEATLKAKGATAVLVMLPAKGNDHAAFVDHLNTYLAAVIISDAPNSTLILKPFIEALTILEME